jgi:hypothetical protein
MLHRLSRLVGLTLLLGLAYVPAAHADTRFSLSIGVPFAPVAAAPAPFGYVWQPGYYVREGFHRRWVPGSWVRDPYHSRNWRHDRDRRNWERDRRDFNRERDRRDFDRSRDRR